MVEVSASIDNISRSDAEFRKVIEAIGELIRDPGPQTQMRALDVTRD